MSEYLRISPGGKLTLYKHNGERQGQHRYHKTKNGELTVCSRETKEIVAVFATEEECDNFFYDKKDIDFVWTHLRSNVFLDKGVTLDDICGVIGSYKELDGLVSFLFPFYPEVVRDRDKNSEPADTLFVNASGQIKQGIYKHEVHLGFTNSRNWHESTIVEIDPNYSIYEDEKILEKTHYTFTLFELMEALFGSASYQSCQLTKDGLETKHRGLMIEDEEIVSCLLNPIYVAEDVVLGDVFEFVEKHEMLRDFLAMYSWCPVIQEFHKQAKETVEEEKEDKLWHFVISRHASFYGRPEGSIDFTPDFGAIGDLSKEEIKWYLEENKPESEWPTHTNYGVGMSHMATLVDLPFVLDEDLEIIWHTKNHKILNRCTFKMCYNLLDFLDAIYWEISFYGSPDQALELREELSEQIKDIKDALDRGEDAGLITLDEFIDEEDDE